MPYAPPGSTTQTAGLTHQASVFYERTNLDRLYPMLRFAQIPEPHPLPMNSGKTIQMKRYALPGFNTTPASEGVIGSPVGQSSSTVTAVVEQYSDFMSASSLLSETDISNTREQMKEDLSYRAAGTVDTIIRTEVDSNTSAQVATQGSSLSAADFKANVALLKGINVKPLQGEDFITIEHPYVTYDLISDNTAGGFIDSLKYAQGTTVLNGEVGKVGGCRILESTNVGSTGTAPNVQYYTYIFGKGGFGQVDLMGRGPDKITDPSNERFTLRDVEGGPNPADPVGEIAYFCSYRFVWAVKTLDTTNLRHKAVKSDASLV